MRLDRRLGYGQSWTAVSSARGPPVAHHQGGGQVANGSRSLGSQSRLLDRVLPPVNLSEPTLARLGAGLLWALVVLAGVAGITAWLRDPATSSDSAAVAGESTGAAEARWQATGLAERYVSAYLLAGNDGSSLAQFLGYTPDMPANSVPDDVVAPARAISVRPAGEEYWSVTVAVGPPGQERFWRAAVDTHGPLPVAVGLPTAVAGPYAVERRDLGVNLGEVPAEDARLETLTGFLGAYLCGSGDLGRYLAPGVVMAAASPSVCSEVDIRRWGVDAVDDTHQTVVLEALLYETEPGADESTPRQAMYTLSLEERDGRWEIADMPLGPPLEED
jgi:hypothetical protein